ncbi:MAG: hypothetical protein ACRD3J_26485, partial [Thermoanaerobaculia bacterium]
MGTVRINFLGVCTIFRDLETTPEGVINRVVFPRATDAFRARTGVDPHIAKLQFEADEIIIDGSPLPPADPPAPNTYKLDGVGLTILNATNTELLPIGGLACLPSLSAFLDGTLGLPAPYVFTPDRENVQAWFDFRGGDARAYVLNPDPPCSTVPSITILTIDTDGDPRLEYRPLDGPVRTITLMRQSGTPGIDVMNFAFGEGVIEDNRDFLLNYWLVDPFPPMSQIVTIPATNACLTPSPNTF